MCQIFVFVGSLFANHHCGVTVYKSFGGSVCTNHLVGVSVYKLCLWGRNVQTIFEVKGGVFLVINHGVSHGCDWPIIR